MLESSATVRKIQPRDPPAAEQLEHGPGFRPERTDGVEGRRGGANALGPARG
jgi:hypothetical protein